MRRTILLCLLAALLVAPAAAHAASATQIIRDCADDSVLQGDYTPAELRNARKHLPTDIDEYSDCRDVLAEAASQKTSSSNRPRTGAAAGASPGAGSAAPAGGSSGSAPAGPGAPATTGTPVATPAPATPAEIQQTVDAAAGRGPGTLDIGGRAVVPGKAGLAADAVRNGLPSIVLIVLILLGAAALAAALPPVRQRVRARRRS
jgi:hypothetical protein